MSEEALPELELEPGTLAIADLHLDPLGDERSAGFAAWLAVLGAPPRLMILGDLFDAWVGPACERLPGTREVLDALAALAGRGTVIEVVPGNRDFLLDGRFEERTGARLRHAGLIGVVPGGGRVLFVHGDELCTRDRGYQRLRRVVRSRPVRWLAPRLPDGVALWFGRRLRRASMRALESKPSEEKSMQPDACRALAGRHRAQALVCGHAHAARDERLAGGPRWIVLDAFGGERGVLEVGPGKEGDAGEVGLQLGTGGGAALAPGRRA